MNVSCLLQPLCPWSCHVNVWKFYKGKEKCDKALLGWLDVIALRDKGTWNILSFKFIFNDGKCLNDWQLTATLLVFHYTHPSSFQHRQLLWLAHTIWTRTQLGLKPKYWTIYQLHKHEKEILCMCVLNCMGVCARAKCTISKCRYRYFNVMVISGNSQV